jgi:hypothetical protein
MKKTIKIICILCISSLFAIQVNAQSQIFLKGDQVAGVGIGIGGNLYSGWGYSSGLTRIPAISVIYEKCVKDNLFDEKSSFGIGGMLGYASASYKPNYGYGYNWGWRSTSIIIGARGALHYALVDKLDTYTSLTVGFRIHTFKWTDAGHTDSGYGNSGITSFWNIGARYFVTNNLAVFGELGYGFAILNLGATLKF